MKTLIIYAHLLAACVAIGVLFLQDFALAKTLGRPLSNTAIAELKKSASIAAISLIVLWITGLWLVLIGYLENPQQYLTNQKLWAKFSVVMVLTINGAVLHHYAFPRVTSPKGVIKLKFFEKLSVVMSGSISSVSWLFACYLGIARPWNGTVSYSFVMFIYILLIIFAFTFGCELLLNNKYLNASIRKQTESKKQSFSFTK